MPIWRQLLLAGLILGLAYGGWTYRDQALRLVGAEAETGPGASRRARRADPVIVAPVRLVPDDVSIAVVGTGLAKRSVTLRSEASGVILEMALAAGARFSQGDALMRLDERDAELALRLAETRLAEAERNRTRAENLTRRGAGSEAARDTAITAAELTRLERDRAERALEDRRLRAPFDGVSALPLVEVGDRVDENDAIADFDDRSAIYVEIALPEALLSRVAPGMTVAAETPALPGRALQGRVAKIDSRVDAASRTAALRAEIPNDDDLLRPGASFTVSMELPGASYPAAPELAIQFARGALFVWRVQNGAAERVNVELVRRRDGLVLVAGDLAEGDMVVIEGAQRLSDGEKVEVLTPETDLTRGGGAS